ncbi:MAG: transferase hexapeptide repeat family protein [Burkholderiales bacterium]|nr:transferase hexapeptide repeat family protein [Burkholderiales bacterium]
MSSAPTVYAFEGIVPVIDPSAYVHPAAVLIGDVIVGPGCYVGPGAVLRGDFGRIVLERNANLQDNCVVHSAPDFDCVMEEESHIGHGAVIHCARIGRDALVGIHAVVMDTAVVGEQAIVAAMSFVKVAEVIAPRVLVAGVPARVRRTLSDDDIAWKRRGTALYIELARRALDGGIVAAQPLDRVEQGRGRTRWEFASVRARGG